MILSLIEDGYVPEVRCRRIGAPLAFERLWEESGCRTVVEELLAGRRFEFAVERAVFLTVLHRLMVSGSDRACENWRDEPLLVSERTLIVLATCEDPIDVDSAMIHKYAIRCRPGGP